ncbi:hypothetical protein FRB96_004854 [Tulasnella sp. 330]|nr:hypothetical protein FRB96_004854 [Tulasnella sp. 330]KAG8885456.1 hypothetical protein FRB97_001179 [Tulasnella sp. 331]KAG8890089.1 hypothetical protein FRB98_001202 [Tulasnella sp. 332]
MLHPAVLLAASFAFTLASAATPGTFEIVGNSGVSAQQLFLGNEKKVYILDKVQGNNVTVSGHPAWVVEYDIDSNTFRPMDVWTNTFCAGGSSAGNGSWISVGGNQPVSPGGDASAAINATNPYMDGDGGQAIGGNLYGGFVNDAGNNNPTWEWWPSRGAVQNLTILETTLPANLYPLTWMLPSGKLFIQTNLGAELFDPLTGVEDVLPDVPHAVRTYPASAATAMLPLTPANNWTATVLFCGGTDLQPDQWTAGLDLTQVAASASCVYMTPDVDQTWYDDDSLPDGRSMSNFIMLPDATLFLCNGANMGVAGYGTESWTKGDSYADVPVQQPLIYDPSKPAGSRFTSDGLSPSTVPRMYHSTATLLPDGSVFVAGSSPHPDVVLNTEYPTTYTVERFYPWYYNMPRPAPTGIPTSVSYGGPIFNISLSATDLNSDGATALEETRVIIIRTGYATHAINFGQRYLQLDNTYTLNADGSAVLHVNQLYPNPSILAPGPAWMFVVVNGVPSTGVQIMVGNGIIGTQPTAAYATLPTKVVPNGVSIPTNASENIQDGANNSVTSAGLKMPTPAEGSVKWMGLFTAVVMGAVAALL